MTASNTPLAYLNGEVIPFAQAHLPVFDLGIMQGATLTERLRTVQHRPYMVREHLDRLERSLASLGWRMPLDMGPLAGIVNDLVRENTRSIAPEEDLAVVIFVTAGQSLGDANGLQQTSRPTVCVYTAPLPLASWADSFLHGAQLVTPAIQQIPGNVLPSQIKHRSRLHWNLADQEVRQQNPAAVALLLDQQGYVTETSTGNLFIVRNNELLTPRMETTLGGIAQSVVVRIAEVQGWTVRRDDLTADEVACADEAFLTSSTYCLLPVSSINGSRLSGSLPGRVTRMFMDNWIEELGLDFSLQSIHSRGQ